MQRDCPHFEEFREKGRLLLLFLCPLATGFGCVDLQRHPLSGQQPVPHGAAGGFGSGCPVLCPADLHGLEGLAEHRELLFLFNAPAPPCC